VWFLVGVSSLCLCCLSYFHQMFDNLLRFNILNENAKEEVE
jgi:hypothetical protein